MRRRKYSRVSAIAVAAALFVMSIPVMATESESVDIQPLAETMEQIESGEDLYEPEYSVEGEETPDVPVYLDDDPVSVESITLSDSSLTLKVGETGTLTATITPPDADQSVTWTSSNEDVVTVDDGTLSAVAEGTATITATSASDSDFSASCEVTVEEESEPEPDPDPEPQVTGITLNKNSLTMNIDESYTLIATITPNDADNQNVLWESSDTSKVTVDENGNIKAQGKAGTATITATSEDNPDCFATCIVTVNVYSGFQQALDGNWYYYKNGSVEKTTDIIKDTVGTIGSKGDWWYVVDGKVTPGVTVAKNSNGWYYINSEGRVDFSFNGFATNKNGSWYIEDGKVTFNKNSVIKDTAGDLGTKGTWYYVVGSQVQFGYTGLANYKNENGWYYIKNGAVDFTANTVAKNINGWYYVEGGKVDFSYNGFATNQNGSWYIENGKVTFNKNSVIKDTTGALGTKGTWYYVVGSQVQYGYTGLANYKNENGWWYIKNGAVDFTANTVAKNKNGWYYVTDGKVQFGFTGLANYSNANGWWYIKDGKVDFSASGVYKNKNGWYYVTGGKVDFSFNGIGSNSNGNWVIKNGKVDFSYNGTYTYGGTIYNVTDGKAKTSYESMGMSSSMYNKAQSQSSSTRWLIMVDVDNCKLGIFQGSYGNWTPYKCWNCTTGASGSPTCRGTYTIYGKGYSFGDDDHTCYYYNQFNGNYLIHSILYYPGTFNVKDVRLGMHLSNGCVRLSLDNAKWVYDNVPYSTRVVTY